MSPRELHAQAVVVDAHTDAILDVAAGRRRLVHRSGQGHVDFPRLRQGDVDVQVFALWVESEYKPERALRRALQLLDALWREVEESGGQAAVATSWRQLEEILRRRQLAVVIGLEGGEALAGSLEVLRIFFRLGVRILGLTWNQRNDLADGVGEEEAGGGLTRLGVQVVREMNRLGMVVDVSHLCTRSFWHVLEVSDKPVIASHSNARALCDHPRNLDDHQIRALAAQGGVMGITFYPEFLCPRPQEASLRHVVDHIDHVVQLVGPEHVGLGSDFDGIVRTPRGLEDATCFPRLTEELYRRGYPAQAIENILGGNFLRVFRQVLPGG